MDNYKIVYEFAASAGAFEGYVYPKNLDTKYLPNWIEHLIEGYNSLPNEVIKEIQPSLDYTLGRAVKSLIPVLGEENESILKLKSMIKGELPESPDDFNKKKWFEK